MLAAALCVAPGPVAAVGAAMPATANSWVFGEVAVYLHYFGEFSIFVEVW